MKLSQTDELKLMFWTQVMPNIAGYELLSSDMKEYFESTFLDVDDENLKNTLQNNEPKRGKDFIIEQPTISEEENSSSDDDEANKSDFMMERVKRAFNNQRNYKGDFGFDTDSDPDDNCVKVVKDQPTQLDDSNNYDVLAKSFNAVLRVNPDDEQIQMPMIQTQHIMRQVEDPNILSDVEYTKKLPGGLQMFFSRIPFFEKKLEEARTVEQDQSISILDVPDFFTSSSSDSPGVLLASTPNRNLRSSTAFSQLSDVERKRADALAKNEAPTTPRSRKPRSKKQALVGVGTVNPRMQTFVNRFEFNVSKRRRDSSSPSSKEN